MIKLKCVNNCRGFTLLEVLIAALITGVLATAAFQFYARMHLQSETQYDISEMQQLCRASIQEIASTLRMAGFKLTGHSAFEIKGDTLAVYYSVTQPVDTILYFLEEFTEAEYQCVPGLPIGIQIWKLMKQTNSNPPQIFADYISAFTCVSVDSATVTVTITSLTSHADEYYGPNSGFRTSSLSERIHVRNST